ncbi:MAG: Cell wall synthesis protein kre9 precursor [Ramalina farinacea]|uniref:Cell wall synthesis protein kre9 n=1 Tax=Ramalina farinacea TaxID=258253 RepID=A0AA43TYC4_9LECA|nr:Cell wall synthesis protein kre9 precursor [Ramalina farinacea]
MALLYIKIISAAPGGTIINYSDRFTLTGMTGTFPPNVQAGIKDISGTDGPKPENNIVDAKDNPAAGANGATDAPYSMQTGLTKFAPMQRKPGTKITLKSASAQYPTTPYTIAKTALPTPKQVTTITASPTYTVASMENTAAALPGPTQGGAMQKFLARWRD